MNLSTSSARFYTNRWDLTLTASCPLFKFLLTNSTTSGIYPYAGGNGQSADAD
jgi:hypothetical protein